MAPIITIHQIMLTTTTKKKQRVNKLNTETDLKWGKNKAYQVLQSKKHFEVWSPSLEMRFWLESRKAAVFTI